MHWTFSNKKDFLFYLRKYDLSTGSLSRTIISRTNANLHKI